jgi:uncharacterized protein (DUF302 family)
MDKIAFKTRLDVPYVAAVEKVTAALKAEGFGVLTEIDVKATMKEKLDADFRKYVILGACNPPIAHKALSAELGVGLFMPCNVVIYEDAEGGSVIDIMNPGAMVRMVPNPALEPVAAEAEVQIRRVVEALGG